MAKFSKYREQFDRMMRYYKRFKELDEGKHHVMPDAYYKDDAYAFFVACYHLRDWIKYDDTIKIKKDKETVKTEKGKRKALGEFIGSNKCMEICRDICNSQKHLKLTRGKEREFDPAHKSLVLGDQGGPKLKVKFVVDGNGSIDAFTLASECVQKWKEFIKEHVI